MSDSERIGHGGSKSNGNDAEDWVIDQYDLAPQDGDRYPELAHDAIDPRTDTPIEIKSCQVYYANGKRGRFQIWQNAHETLLEHGGGYVFVVQEPHHPDGTLVYLHRPLSAAQVDARIETWYPIDHQLKPDDTHRTSLAQSDIFTDITVDRDPHRSPEPAEQPAEHTFDADVIEEPEPDGITHHDRMQTVKQTIRQIEEQHPHDKAPEGAVIASLRADGIPERKAETDIEDLKKRGDIYEPTEGAYRSV